MELDDLQRKLIAAARAHPPSDAVPYAFEQRIMACLAVRPKLDAGALWARALWRATTPCVIIMVLLGTWSICSAHWTVASRDYAQDFEKTLLAVTDTEPASDSLW